MSAEIAVVGVAGAAAVGLLGLAIGFDSWRAAKLNGAWSAYAQSRGMRFTPPVNWSWVSPGRGGKVPHIDGAVEGLAIVIECFHSGRAVWSRARCHAPALPPRASLWIAAQDAGTALGLGLVGGRPPPIGDPTFDAEFYVFAADVAPLASLPPPVRDGLRALSRRRGGVTVRAGSALADAPEPGAGPPLAELSWKGSRADPDVFDLAVRTLHGLAVGRA